MEGEKEWIEAPEGWGNSNQEEDSADAALVDFFADPDPRQSFHFQLVQEDGQQSKTVYLSGFKLNSSETDNSTGVTLWEGSKQLAKYLVQQSSEFIRGKRVLELGAGLGLIGIVARSLGAQQVVLTDGDTNVLAQMRTNVQNNCDGGHHTASTICCRQLMWGSDQCESFHKTFGVFDTLLAADVIYTPESITPLFETASMLMTKPTGRFVLSWFTRVNGVTVERMLNAATSANLKWTETEEGIFVFRHRVDDLHGNRIACNILQSQCDADRHENQTDRQT